MKPQSCVGCFGLLGLCQLVGCGSSTQNAFDRLIQEKKTVDTQRGTWKQITEWIVGPR